MTQTELALELSRKIIENAHDVGADVIVTACPLCHINLDGRQKQMGLDYEMPVLYITDPCIIRGTASCLLQRGVPSG
ncbi:MAG: heterodisulfide reductase-related iron-sulfur binding cluster [Anaerolineae bacterium]